MNARNSTSRRNNVGLMAEDNAGEEEAEVEEPDSKSTGNSNKTNNNNKTRKKREELSISATKSIKKETVEIVVSFN
jgi:hypothetical protein